MEKSSNTPLIIFVIAIIIMAIYFAAGGTSNKTTKESTVKTTTPSSITTKKTTTTTTTSTPKQVKITWKCVDATSYNKNPYDDNKCISSDGQVRYVSDSESRKLDPSYTPGTKGHSYYNSF
jgi:hypothetical protein